MELLIKINIIATETILSVCIKLYLTSGANERETIIAYNKNSKSSIVDLSLTIFCLPDTISNTKTIEIRTDAI